MGKHIFFISATHKGSVRKLFDDIFCTFYSLFEINQITKIVDKNICPRKLNTHPFYLPNKKSILSFDENKEKAL